MHPMHSAPEEDSYEDDYFENETEPTKPEIYDDDTYYADAKPYADATTYDPETEPCTGIGQANHYDNEKCILDTEGGYGIEDGCYYAGERAFLYE